MSFEDFALRVDDALTPGIAAEIAARIPRMPVGPTVAPGHDALWWSCDAELPMRPDPRLPECFFQLAASSTSNCRARATLDLFDVRESARTHQFAILQPRAERRAVSGWFH